ncbi:hypothetical protein BDA96_04G125800 [Sorghum bicolor]|uniref:Uncharacterized protein n=1 Tax=Sorghum bicolor TaxID=4558 RepID=A0A921U8W9_SORBI|nr:hypothetical protein BDA96_07G056500 [Sorghum bicolor]KAG0532653.1 hypothetical protein BDA96_04G125800 [Sorghum bicolor]
MMTYYSWPTIQFCFPRHIAICKNYCDSVLRYVPYVSVTNMILNFVARDEYAIIFEL